MERRYPRDYINGLPVNYINILDTLDFLKKDRQEVRLALTKDRYIDALIDIGFDEIATRVKKFNRVENGTLRDTFGIYKPDWDYYKKYRTLRPEEYEEENNNTSLTVDKEIGERFKRFIDYLNGYSTRRITYKDALGVAIDEYIRRRQRHN